jgi:hypothetical protein
LDAEHNIVSGLVLAMQLCNRHPLRDKTLLFAMIQGTFCMIQGTFGMIQGTFGMIRGTFGMIQETFGMIQRTFGMIQFELWWMPMSPYSNWKKQLRKYQS